jgi:hypothetical protein
MTGFFALLFAALTACGWYYDASAFYVWASVAAGTGLMAALIQSIRFEPVGGEPQPAPVRSGSQYKHCLEVFSDVENQWVPVLSDFNRHTVVGQAQHLESQGHKARVITVPR